MKTCETKVKSISKGMELTEELQADEKLNKQRCSEENKQGRRSDTTAIIGQVAANRLGG